MNPLVSLITPFYDAMPYFRTYLACVLLQTWRPLEFIAVDDGSSDNSWECLMESMPELEKVGISVQALHIDHGGQAAAVNAALPLVSGEYITWCDADDWMSPDCVSKKAEHLIRFPEQELVRSDGLVYDGDSGRLLAFSARREDRRTQNIFDGLFFGTTYCYAGCYMGRASSLFQAYPDRQIPISPEGQNLQLLLPLASRSECGFIPDVLHRYYRRSRGHSSKKLNFRSAYSRLSNFSALRRAIIPHCLCDAEYYIEEDRKLTADAQRALCNTVAAQVRKKMRT
ncbi:MAG: glycosyltransferase family 2 protein [Clostridia bacterium]|nr:glycosyltransferase family 2 protein [Clostridia bacterium]